MTVVGVVVAGALGAIVRHLVLMRVDGRRRSTLPVGLVAVNVVGSLALGLLVGARRDGGLTAAEATVLGTGLCGALTTWSTFAVDLAERLRGGARGSAVAVAGATVGLGLAAAALGVALGGALAA